MTQRLILTRGLSASGKSTAAKSWVSESPQIRARVNRDDIRFATFVIPDYSYRQEKVVTEIELGSVNALLDDGKDVVVDATHLRMRFLRNWQKLAHKRGIKFEVWDFPIELEEAIKRDSHRGERSVGEHVISNQYKKFTKNGELPEIPEYVPTQRPEELVQYEPNTSLPKAIIVDIDGTLAHCGDRNIYDLTRVHEDTPNAPVVETVKVFAAQGYEIVYCSGREDVSRKNTHDWIKDNVGIDGPLFMRKAGDERKDSIVKMEIFDSEIRDKYNVLLTVDDRDQVVKFWRDIGLTCLQCNYGDF